MFWYGVLIGVVLMLVLRALFNDIIKPDLKENEFQRWYNSGYKQGYNTGYKKGYDDGNKNLFEIIKNIKNNI